MQTQIHKDTTGLVVLWDDRAKCYLFEDSTDGRLMQFTLKMQTGNPQQDGYNGPTIEALLAIARHRIQNYNTGAYVCEENFTAIHHIQQAVSSLFKRFRRLANV